MFEHRFITILHASGYIECSVSGSFCKCGTTKRDEIQ